MPEIAATGYPMAWGDGSGESKEDVMREEMKARAQNVARRWFLSTGVPCPPSDIEFMAQWFAEFGQSEYERGKREAAERCAEIAGDSARWQKYADKPRHIADAIRSEFSLSEKKSDDMGEIMSDFEIEGLRADQESYIEAIRECYGEGMGDGCEETLACGIARLKRLAEQGVALRTAFGEKVWHLSDEETLEFCRQLAREREALAALVAVIESDDVPGYLGDETGWECGQCAPEDGSGKRPTTAEVPHEPDCFQGALEKARAAVAGGDHNREEMSS